MARAARFYGLQLKTVNDGIFLGEPDQVAARGRQPRYPSGIRQGAI